ncbi:MAG: helix-turn-helix transcriptional regulator [Lautropia sp.]|nr:helix-turn-helix transcriptional regulator [Lautropia sp.]
MPAAELTAGLASTEGVFPGVTAPADLQQAREARRWSRLDVARLTKFQVRQIAALEEGRFEELPGRAFVRAALRNYGAVLSVDVTPLLASIGGHAEPAPLTIRLRYSEAALQADMGAEYEPATRSRASRWFWGLMGLLAVLALGFWFGSGGSTQWQPRQWLDDFMTTGKPVESSPAARRASGKVTEPVTWSWAPAEQAPAATATGPKQ